MVAAFSEAVTGLTAGDFEITNGTAEDLEEEQHSGGTVYSFFIDPDGEGPVTVRLPADSAEDGVGNGNVASSQHRLLVGNPGTVTIVPNSSNIAEGRAVAFVLRRSVDNGARAIQVEVSQQGDFLDGGTSFGTSVDSTPLTVSVDFGAGETTKTITLDTTDDYFDEPDGSVTLTVLRDPTEVGYLVGTPHAATTSVRDNDSALTMSIQADKHDYGAGDSVGEVEEGDSIEVRLLRSRDAGDQTVDLKITQQGDFLAARHPENVVIPADGRIQITIPAGLNSKSFLLNTLDDAAEENDGSVTIAVSPRPDDPLNPATVYFNPATVVVRDNDAPPTITIAADTQSVTEGESIVYTVERTSEPGEITRAMLLVVDITQAGDVLGPRAPARVTLWFAEDRTTTSFTITTHDDRTTESNGRVTASVRTPPLPGTHTADPYLLGTPHTVTTAVHDNEDPVVSISPVASTVTEGSDALFRVSKIGGETGPLNVGVSIFGHRKIMSDATRTLANSTGALADTVVTFDAGTSEATLTLTTEGDRENEGDGEITVIIEGAPTYRVDGTGTAAVLVEDDDIPEVTLTWVSPPMTLEGNVWVGSMTEGQDVRYRVDCSGTSTAPALDPGFGLASRLLRIATRHQELLNHPTAPGGFNRDLHMRMPCSNEPDPTFDLVFSHRERRWTGPDNGEIQVDLLSQRIMSGGGTTLSLRSCYFDEVYGTPEDVRFCPEYTLGAVTSARIEVVNRNPTIVVEALADEVTEGEPARFRLTRIWEASFLSADPGAGYKTTVDFETTAVGVGLGAGGDPVAAALPGGPYTFELGVTEHVIEVPTVDDFLPGPDGEVTLTILPGLPETQAQNIAGTYEVYDFLPGITPSGKSSRTATVRILNDDVVPLMSVADGFAEEGDAVEFAVTLSDSHDQTVTADWTLADGTAVAGSDYTAASGTVTFSVGDVRKTIAVTTIDDDVQERDETFTLTLANVESGVFPDGAATVTATGTIGNGGDLSIVNISAPNPLIEEGRSRNSS